MRRLLACLCLLVPPAHAGTATVSAFRGPLARGASQMALHCSFHIAAPAGSALAAAVVTSGPYVIGSYTALVDWNHAAIAPVVLIDGTGIEASAGGVAVTSETVTVSVSLPVGGPYTGEIAGGCGSDGASVDDATLSLGGATLPAATDASYVTMRPAAFHATAAGAGFGATVVAGGDALVAGTSTIGVFQAASGSLSTTSPDGTISSSTNITGPSLLVAGDGPFRLSIAWATVPASGVLYRGIAFP